MCAHVCMHACVRARERASSYALCQQQRRWAYPPHAHHPPSIHLVPLDCCVRPQASGYGRQRLWASVAYGASAPVAGFVIGASRLGLGAQLQHHHHHHHQIATCIVIGTSRPTRTGCACTAARLIRVDHTAGMPCAVPHPCSNATAASRARWRAHACMQQRPHAQVCLRLRSRAQVLPSSCTACCRCLQWWRPRPCATCGGHSAHSAHGTRSSWRAAARRAAGLPARALRLKALT